MLLEIELYCLLYHCFILFFLFFLSVLGIIGRLIHETANYTHNRKAFGKSLLDNQVIHFRLAELETELEALRSLVYRATGILFFSIHVFLLRIFPFEAQIFLQIYSYTVCTVLNFVFLTTCI